MKSLIIIYFVYPFTGFHSGWNQAIGVRHPSLWTFLRHQKDFQATLEVQLDASDRGDRPPARKRKWRKLEERIVRLKREYENGERNLTEYWKAISHCIAQFH